MIYIFSVLLVWCLSGLSCFVFCFGMMVKSRVVFWSGFDSDSKKIFCLSLLLGISFWLCIIGDVSIYEIRKWKWPFRLPKSKEERFLDILES